MTITSNEITAAKVAAVFQNFLQNLHPDAFNYEKNNPNLFNLKDYNNLIIELLQHFGTDKQINISHNFARNKFSFREINIKYQNKLITNVTELNFAAAYPSIMMHKIDNFEMLFNYADFGQLYSFIVKNKSEFKYDSNIYKLTKTFINMLYGVLQNKRSLLQSNITADDICAELYSIDEKIYRKFKQHIPYINTDVIFVKNYDTIKDEFNAYVHSLTNLKLEIDDTSDAIFILPGKYMLIKNNKTEYHGIQMID